MERILNCGDTALLVEFGDTIDRALSGRVLAAADRIAAAAIAGVVETVPTFRSLTVHYDPVRIGSAELQGRLALLIEGLEARETVGRLWRLPACYDLSVGLDVEDVAARAGLSVSQLIECHSAELYHVYQIGFLPGFPYMGDLPEALRLPRRETPRVSVPAGSIAIAMALSSVYTLDSPGGWHVLGRTPVPLWDLRREPPVLLAPGDKVRFEPVSLDSYGKALELARSGRLSLMPETMPEVSP